LVYLCNYIKPQEVAQANDGAFIQDNICNII